MSAEGLYEASGGDPNVCEFCHEPLDLDNPRSWARGLDGAGAHRTCLRKSACLGIPVGLAVLPS